MSLSLSRAEVAAMDREELVETIVELSGTVEDLAESESLAALEIAALRKLLAGLADVDSDDADPTEMSAMDKASVAVDRINGLADRVDDLEKENERLRSRLEGSSSRGKDQKVADIVQFADNARGADPAIKLTAKDIKGATGCSTRYAYDLMDDLPEEYDWFLTPREMTQYGSLEVDNTDERRLGVDFEGVHSSGCPLNKFNNDSSQEGSQ
ncbi:hypothetical protein NDI56_04065 [Haloarcula sp. S1CR25-12]|uniref:Uncharacterized protein n=1 Tax=Haloarcula saliterrae TaxID=2950534 RepID=A0ABU2F9U9_9EURY|nr:hypothetical protein [Haloarcula sp. S1CR25-12]MDS0258586.1 hypothetical protein [Haloarcula sp. S1CR25-12]